MPLLLGCKGNIFANVAILHYYVLLGKVKYTNGNKTGFLPHLMFKRSFGSFGTAFGSILDLPVDTLNREY